MANGGKSPKEMTDKEIIKALECCIKPTSDCDNCPLDVRDDDNCFDRAKQGALNIINRQQVELNNYSHNVRNMSKDFIEQQKIIQEQQAEIEKLTTIAESYHEAALIAMELQRKQGIKEFADRLEEAICKIPQHHFTLAGVIWLIKKFVKEMVGDDK